MKDVIGSAQRSWNDLLHGDTFGPYVMRRAIPLLIVALGVTFLSVSEIVPWKISLLAGLSMGILLFGLRRRSEKRLVGPIEITPTRPTIDYHVPVTAVATETSAPAPVFIDDRRTDEMEPIDPSMPPPPVPKSVKDSHTPLYDHHFHFMWWIEKVSLSAYLIFVLVVLQFAASKAASFLSQTLEGTPTKVRLDDFQVPGGSLAWVVGLDLLLIIAWSVRALYVKQDWDSMRFIVTADLYSITRSMPDPFSDVTKAIRTLEITYMIKRNWLDKRLGTCRLLYGGDKENTKIDDVFLEVKWLKYPEELYAATGIAPVRKARWFQGKQR